MDADNTVSTSPTLGKDAPRLHRWWRVRGERGEPRTSNFQCPHCGLHSLHTCIEVVEGHQTSGEIESRSKAGWSAVRTRLQLTHWIMRCVNCRKDTYVLVKEAPPARHPADAELICIPTIVHQHPVCLPSTHAAVPVEIALAAEEAERCLAAGAPNACAVMTRRAIHSLCEDRSAAGRDLFAQLKDLKERQIITTDLHEWADDLRVLGRDGAHPEHPPVAEDDALDGVKLLREIIRFVYIIPHERAQTRGKKI